MVDIRLFFANGPQNTVSHPALPQLHTYTNQFQKKRPQTQSNASKSKPKTSTAKLATKQESVEIISDDEVPAKRQKTLPESSSKYFPAETKESIDELPETPVAKKPATPKKISKPVVEESPEKPKPAGRRRAAKKTYINLDSDMEDSEEEFKPDVEEEAEDDDFEADENAAEELEDGAIDVDAEDEALKEEESIQEIEPEPKPKKAPARKPKKPSELPAAVTGVHADEILDKIPNAELPDAPETDGKLNYFALKGKQQNVAPPSGDIDLPEAAPNCLGGLTVVFTGVLPSLDRSAAENLAKRYGAKVTKSILGKTSLVVIGEEAGPSKVKKIKDLGIKAITEQGFIELLRLMPADGGDSDQARLAKLKREEEEQMILEQAAAEEEAEQQRVKKERLEREKRDREAAKKAQKSAASTNTKAAPVSSLPKSMPREISNDEKLWTSKYAPTSVTQLCGNKSQVEKLRTWLSNWFTYSKNNFDGSGPDGSKFRAALISGPPGIGKTTAAHLIANELGYDVLEKNASDVRSKSLLNSEIKSVLNNTSVVGFFKHKDDANPGSNDKKFCLIMDEVDGMSSGDHGGAGALSAFCRITKMPMILICNDKSLQKMRTFDTVTYQLPFRRPTEVEMRARLLTIAHREKLKLEPAVIGQLVQATGNDIRQIINLMSTVSKTQKVIGHENSKAIAESWKKHVLLKPFEITSTLLGGPIFNPSSKSTLNDKLDLYFSDIDFAPLMIQENYLMTLPAVLSKTEHLKRIAKAADSISQSDSVNSLIRSSEQQWSLLPFHGILSTVAPAAQVNGRITGRINFSAWLGNNSKTMKNQRLLQEVQYHTRLRTSTSKSELRLDYVPAMREALTLPLINEGDAGIPQVIEAMDHYYLTKEDWDSILGFGVGTANGVALKINTKTKTAMTRKYNTMQHPIAIFKTGNSVGSSAGAKRKVDFEDVVEDDTAKDEEVEVEDNDAIDAKKDKLIKKVVPKSGAKGGKKAAAKKPTKRAKK
ncbi:hypothetical protein PUMCH_003507 [Australozyma saopauloensis]|uniref:Replication factor C subunit 1 n=1 Tax=Australozyma saopauloensis TaxID=291208 RepID=A0AAX4HC55_9ASCO|nr:hypothetical protein PUMCH_003507 [[Candida] saopauloensis]